MAQFYTSLFRLFNFRLFTTYNVTGTFIKSAGHVVCGLFFLMAAHLWLFPATPLLAASLPQSMPSASLTIDDVSHSEGNYLSTLYTFTVTLDQAVTNTVRVDFSIVTTDALTGVDFVLLSASPITFTGAVSETQPIVVAVQGDGVVERDESFAISLTAIDAGGSNVVIGDVVIGDVVIADGLGMGLIANDDTATVVVNNLELDEGDSGVQRVEFIVSLSHEVAEDVTVIAQTVAESASSDTDYGSVQTTLTFPAGANGPQTVIVDVQGDQWVELDESFQLSLANAQFGGQAAPAQVTVCIMDCGTATIRNNDSTEISIQDVQRTENEGELAFLVSLTHLSAQTVTVEYTTVAESANQGTDFQASPGQLTILPGNPNALIVLPLIEDKVAELTETLTVYLADPIIANLGDDHATGTILDNDHAPFATNDRYRMTEDGVLSVAVGSLLQNDGDVDNDSLSTVLLNTTVYGTLELYNDGSFAYEPEADFYGEDSFTYQASDGFNLSVPVTVTIQIAPFVGVQLDVSASIINVLPECGDPIAIKVPVGTPLRYCYTLTNYSSVRLSIHHLRDNIHGIILDGWAHDLAAGESISVTTLATPTVTTTNIATWTATLPLGATNLTGVTATDSIQIKQGVTVLISEANDDQDEDGIDDNLERAGDGDQDNLPNFLDSDSDGDLIPDAVETTEDADQDTTPNYLDLDSDNDSLLDREEAGEDPELPRDSNGNGLPDYREPTPREAIIEIYLPIVKR